jgi:GH25 family lysozyme M1 (1,4-beta-N-acetylmuramidase)
MEAKIMKNGIDVSKHNGVINWNAVKQSGEVDFAILRAGYGKSISQKDAKFEQNYAGAKAAGIPVGAYWYCYAKTPAEAKQEALVCIECLKGKQFELPVYYDIEEDATFRTGINNVSAIADTFCEELEKAGYYVGIYAAKSHLENYFTNSVKNRYTVWVAHVNVTKTNYTGIYTVWQYSWKGKIPGIKGDVDLDYCYRDFPEEIKAAGLNGYRKPVEVPSKPTEAQVKDTVKVTMEINGKPYSGVLEAAE